MFACHLYDIPSSEGVALDVEVHGVGADLENSPDNLSPRRSGRLLILDKIRGRPLCTFLMWRLRFLRLEYD